MLTIDITINGRTIHKFLIGRGPQWPDGRHAYTIFDNNFRDLGVVAHDRENGALALSIDALKMIDHHYGKEGPDARTTEEKLQVIRQVARDMMTDPDTVRELERRSKELSGRVFQVK